MATVLIFVMTIPGSSFYSPTCAVEPGLNHILMELHHMHFLDLASSALLCESLYIVATIVSLTFPIEKVRHSDQSLGHWRASGWLRGVCCAGSGAPSWSLGAQVSPGPVGWIHQFLGMHTRHLTRKPHHARVGGQCLEFPGGRGLGDILLCHAFALLPVHWHLTVLRFAFLWINLLFFYQRL